ncbi:MAG TPA: aminotransferase class IV [Streptosporangiaceae bacterium]|nr:aminotransferase class IV [Streptosporangiaceae bacterium]
MVIFLNGSLLDEGQARIPVFDHGLTVGDGVFETVKVTGGEPFALRRHLDRLGLSASRLGLPAPDLAALSAGAHALLDAAGNPETARMRITVTGGNSPLGSQRGNEPLTTVIALAELNDWGGPCDVVTVPWTRNEHGALTGIKTTSYAENVRALAYAAKRGASEAIFANTQGNLCEGTGSNVFLVTGGELVTPPLSSGCLAGITRALVLEWFGGTERDVSMATLATADEAFLTSTTRDVQAIKVVDGVQLPDAPGPVTRKAAQVFASRAALSPDP